jgi:hypothetical protein
VNEPHAILWLADEEGWAYDAIYKSQSQRLPHYSHEVFYMMRKANEWNDWVRLGRMIEQADIVVAMHMMYSVQVSGAATDKAVVMLTGPRIFE